MKKTGLCLLMLLICLSGYPQDTIVVPVDGSGGFFNTCYATIWDSGLDSNYTDETNATVTISPLWAETVSLYFEVFELETFFDELFIYDGPSQTFPLIGSYSGTTLQGQTISSTGNSITLKFITDDVETGQGFKAWVSCMVGIGEEDNDPLKIYPVPAETYIQLEGMNTEEIKNIYLTDAGGRVVMTGGKAPVLDVQALVPGIYFLVVQKTNGKLIHRRWIKK